MIHEETIVAEVLDRLKKENHAYLAYVTDVKGTEKPMFGVAGRNVVDFDNPGDFLAFLMRSSGMSKTQVKHSLVMAANNL